MIAVDLFAGWGGFTLGAEAAGVRVRGAYNHWQTAVDAHALNHPGAQHVCQDLRQANWTELPRYDLLLAGPACPGWSPASQPKRREYHDAMRATVWAVVDCAEVTTPRGIIVENVPQLQAWKLYPRWRGCLEDLGYCVSEHRLVASRFGVPQQRDRLFVVATRRPGFRYTGPRRAEPGFGPCVQWDAGRWRAVAKASSNVRGRIAAGRKRHGRRFVTQHVTGHKGRSLDGPLPTITCQDQLAVVDGNRYRPLTVRETARGMGFPDHYGWPEDTNRRDQIRGLGNAVCPPVAECIVRAVASHVG
jgi:DNA (cytosine-5)-methyltransferase 1